MLNRPKNVLVLGCKSSILHLSLSALLCTTALSVNAATIDYVGGTTNSNAISTTTVDPVILNSVDSGSATQSGIISGDGSITKTGAGSIILITANAYSGGTNILGGTLIAEGYPGTAALRLGTGAILIDNNATLATHGSFNSSNNLTIGSGGANISFNGTTTNSLSGIISGSGLLNLTKSGGSWGNVTLSNSGNTYSGGTNITGNGFAVLVSATGALGTGDVSVGTGSTLQITNGAEAGDRTVVNNGTVRIVAASTAALTSIENASGAQVDVSTVTSATEIGSISGAGTVALGTTVLTIGGLNLNDTISGVIRIPAARPPPRAARL